VEYHLVNHIDQALLVMICSVPRILPEQSQGDTPAAFRPTQSHCTTWLRRCLVVIIVGKPLAQEAKMFIADRRTSLEPPDATMISYTLLRHLGFMLDELSAQGLTLWQDERQAWRWAWTTTGLQTERGFWAIGEAIVDAVVTRFPAAFDGTAVVE
jgi:hypothetical protein